MTPVEQIKSRLSIVDVVGSYIKLTKAGSSYKALCPFHHEKTPSFNISPVRDAFYCFGCNKGGDIFTFVEEIEGMEFPEALRMLAEKAGVVLVPTDRRETNERERLRELVDEATSYYESELAKKADARLYLGKRGLSDETIRSFRIGYAPLVWRNASEHLREKGFTDDELLNAGIVKRPDAESGDRSGGEKKPYDRFRGRVMFPIFDSNGRPVAFSGRILGNQKNPDGSEPAKYINSPETPLYDKGRTLFGYDRARNAIRTQNFAVLVEGQMDLIMAHQAGAKNTLAVSGTSLTEEHLALIKRLTDNVVFAFDADPAGRKATARAFRLALGIGLHVRVAAIPEGKDPADFILAHPEKFSEIISSSTHIIDYYLNALGKEVSDKRTFEVAVSTDVLPLLAVMTSKIEQAHYAIQVARRLGVPESAVLEDLKRVAIREAAVGDTVRQKEEQTDRSTPKSRRQLAEEEILGILLWQKGHKEPVLDHTELRRAYEERLRLHSAMPWEPDADDERNMVIRVENTYEHSPLLRDTVHEMLDVLETEILREKQQHLLEGIAAAEREGKKGDADAFLVEYRAVTPRLIELENKRQGT